MKLKTLFIGLIGIALIATVAQTAASDLQLELAARYTNQALQYLRQGQFQQALPLVEKAFEIRGNKLGKTHQDTLVTQTILAVIYQELGRSEALPLSKTAYRLSQQTLGDRHEVTLTSLNNLVMIYQKLGRLSEALPLLEKNYRLSQEVLGEKHPTTLERLTNLVTVYQKLGRHDEALPLYEKGYRLSKEVLGEKHPINLSILNNLATIYQSLGHFSEALPLSVKSYRFHKKVLGNQHPNTIESLRSLATIYQDLGLFNIALLLSEKDYHLSQKVLGEKHPNTLGSLNTLAGIYKDLGRLSETLPLIKKGYRLSQEVLGEKHPETLTSLNNLAIIYQELGSLDEALLLYEEGYRLSQEVLGEKHPDTLNSLNNLAVIYQELGRLSKALSLSEKSYHLRKDVLGEKHPNTLNSLNNLAAIYQKFGRLSDALPLFEENYRFSKDVLGEKHPNTLNSLNNLAAIYQKLGRLSDALPLSEKSDHLSKEVLGEKHPDTLNSLNNLAGIYQALGRLSDALPLFEKGYRLSKEVLEEKHPKTLTRLNNLALIYQKLGSLTDALPLHNKSYRLRIEVLGEEHPDTLQSLNNLATIYLELGSLTDALPLLEKNYRLHKEVLGEKHPHTITSLNNLAEIYSSLGRLSSLSEALQNSYRISKEVLGEQHPLTLVSLKKLAFIYAKLGKTQEAIKHLETFVKGVEHLRSGDFSAENRQALFQKWVPGYFRLSKLYISQSRFQDAFRLAEMTKARTLLDSMALKLAVQQAGLTKPEQKQFQAYSTQRNAFNKLIAETAELEKRIEFERQKNQAVKQLADLQRVLMDKYPKFKQLVDHKIITATEGAKDIPSDALFISYLMQGNEVFVFTLDARGELRADDLGEIAGLQQTLKTYSELLGEQCTVIQLRRQKCGGKSVWQLTNGSFVINRTRPKNAKKRRISKLDDISRYLGDKLLAPLKKRLGSKSRWLISPDGALALIPFETLILDKAPVIQAHSISYVQSLSVLLMLKQREQKYQQFKNRGTLLAMGNARYELPENRPPKGNESTQNPDIDVETILSRGANDPQRYQKAFQAKGKKWDNLEGAEKELATLEKLFANQRPSIYKQAEASEANLQRLNREQVLTRYRYLVFSAHGYFDAQTPELSVIVLDQLDKTPGTDGFITASEWVGYNLRSDLMVLSACESGLGKNMRGEGVMGLPYALYVAGNKNTLMTLWKVLDDSTAEFSERFFTKLKRGMDQVEALTETKREFLQSDKYKRPLFWAPFVLYGI